MEKNLKQLLLRDLCARLPYGIKAQYDIHEINTIAGELEELHDQDIGVIDGFFGDSFRIDGYKVYLESIKPYLRPISNLKIGEIDNLFKILKIKEDSDSSEWLKINDIGIIRLYTEEGKDFYEIAEAMDYLNSIHIDYRGLIEKGLALEAPKDMYNNQ